MAASLHKFGRGFADPPINKTVAHLAIDPK